MSDRVWSDGDRRFAVIAGSRHWRDVTGLSALVTSQVTWTEVCGAESTRLRGTCTTPADIVSPTCCYGRSELVMCGCDFLLVGYSEGGVQGRIQEFAKGGLYLPSPSFPSSFFPSYPPPFPFPSPLASFPLKSSSLEFQLGGLGSAISSPSEVRGRAPAENKFGAL